MIELEQNLEKFLQFAATKNPKLKTKKFVIGSEVEYGSSVSTIVKVKNQEIIFITPKGKRIKAFEELRRPETKRDCQVFSGMEPNNCFRDSFDKKSNSVEGVFHLDRRNAKRIRSC